MPVLIFPWPDYESEGRRFEPCRARQIITASARAEAFFISRQLTGSQLPRAPFRTPRSMNAARCTSRTPCASSTTAGCKYLAASGREFGHGTIVQYSRHCPLPHSPNAARGTIPPRERRRHVARTERSGKATGARGQPAPQERRERGRRLGTPFSAPINGCSEQQMGTSSFSSCHGLYPFSVAADAALPCPSLPSTRASRPGLHSAAAGAAGSGRRPTRISTPQASTGPRQNAGPQERMRVIVNERTRD